MSKYWEILQEQYQQLAAKVNQVVLRERVLLLIALVAVICVIWSLLFMFPQRNAINLAKVTETGLVEQIAQLQQRITSIEQNTATLSALGIKPSTGLISNLDLILMLKSLLAKQSSIVLKELHNLPDQPLSLSANDADVKLPMPLYERGLRLVFNGGYSTFYEYLRSLENLKWMIFWDELQYTVTEYPNAEIKLTIHTISPIKEN